MSDNKQKGFVDTVWDFLASIKLAIVTFALIALSSIVGTLIQQGPGVQGENMQVLTKLVGAAFAPRVYAILEFVGFMNMYHSWWFMGFLLLFCVNLIICSLDRLPPIIRMIREPLKPLSEDQMTRFPIKRELSVKGGPEPVLAAIRRLGIPLAEHEGEGGSRQYYGQSGAYTRLGVYVVHLSILVIMAGAVVGLFMGFNGFLNLPEGEAYGYALGTGRMNDALYQERVQVANAFSEYKGDMAALAQYFGRSEADLKRRMKTLGVEPFGFEVYCEEFQVQFYKDSNMPKEYTSHLVVYDGGRKVMDKWIEVNDPLKYKGYYFYQSSYGPNNDRGQFVYKLRVTSSAGATEDFALRVGEGFTIPGTEVRGTVKGFDPAYGYPEDSQQTTMMANPAVLIEIESGGRSQGRWFMQRYPKYWSLPEGHVIQPMDIWGTQYTGLQVRKDPGVGTVYLGCLIMTIGLYAAFFMSHRRLYVLVRQDKGRTSVLLAASAHKNKEGFIRKIEAALGPLSEGGNK